MLSLSDILYSIEIINEEIDLSLMKYIIFYMLFRFEEDNCYFYMSLKMIWC
jgi:hypothetical protein